MDAIDNHEEPFSDDDYDDLEEKRSIIRQSLDEIAADVGTALLKANLTFPIGLTTPSSGRAFLTIVTQNDPSDEEWAQGITNRTADRQQKAGWNEVTQPITTLHDGELPY